LDDFARFLFLENDKIKGIPMSDIQQSFIKQFEADVHLAYQQMGTKLRATVRSKDGVIGQTAVFQKVGKGIASTKSRHGMVPVMNLDHEPVECPLLDYYAGDWIDALDELKTNIDERRVVASAGAYALGRKTDDLILSAMAAATKSVGDDETYLTKDIVLEAMGELNKAEVPDDGNRFCIVGVENWNALLSIDEFISSDYTGDLKPLMSGTEVKRWLGINWLLCNSLPAGRCYMYHSSAIGHACGQDVKTDITWHGERAAHFVSNSMSQGAVLIDNSGIIRLNCNQPE
jgi:hypothetical protein